MIALGINASNGCRWTLPTRHLNTFRGRLSLEPKGTEHVHGALETVRFLVRSMRSPMQASAWSERKQSSKGRKEVVGVAQIHIERLRVGFDGRQGPLIGPRDAKCRRKLGQEVATKGVFGLRPSLEMDGTSGAPHPKQGKGRH